MKVPHGTQLLFLLAVGLTLLAPRLASWRDELVLLAPAVGLFALVSSQTEFSHHFRYVLPSLGLLAIFLGKPIFYWAGDSRWGGGHRTVAVLVLLLLTASVFSSLRVHPHSLAYFNEVAGGPANGWKHMLGSSLDWGQDLFVIQNLPATISREGLYGGVVKAYYDPQDVGIRCAVRRNCTIPAFPGQSCTELTPDWPSGFYVVSIEWLAGTDAPWPAESQQSRRTFAADDLKSLIRVSPTLFLLHVRPGFVMRAGGHAHSLKTISDR